MSDVNRRSPLRQFLAAWYARIRKYYGAIASVLLVVLAILSGWNKIADSLGVPGPALVSSEVHNAIVGEPALLAIYDPEIASSASGQASVLKPAAPLPTLCHQSVRVKVGDRLDSPTPKEPDSSISFVPTPFFVFVDKPTDYEELRIGPPKPDYRYLTLSFGVGNPGVEPYLTIEHLLIRTVDIQPVETYLYPLVLDWDRGAVALPQTGPGALDLDAELPVLGAESTAKLRGSELTIINFRADANESLRISIRVPFSEPGLYKIQTSITGFTRDGTPFTAAGPPFSFGWTTLSNSTFASSEVRHFFTTGCTPPTDTSTQPTSYAVPNFGNIAPGMENGLRL